MCQMLWRFFEKLEGKCQGINDSMWRPDIVLSSFYELEAFIFFNLVIGYIAVR